MKFRNLKAFVDEGKKGDKYVYHTGMLSIDRQENDLLNKTANDILELYQRGFVEIFQRRLGKNKFEYYAIRTNDVGRRYFSGCYKQ